MQVLEFGLVTLVCVGKGNRQQFFLFLFLHNRDTIWRKGRKEGRKEDKDRMEQMIGKYHIHSSTVCDLYTPPASLLPSSPPFAANSRSERPPKSTSRSRSSSVIVVVSTARGGGGLALALTRLRSSVSALRIFFNTASDSVPSSTVCDCRRDEP